MGLLVVKRKHQIGQAYDNNLKVVIDNTQIVEVSNGETKEIELSDGSHSVDFLYYFKPNTPIPMMDILEINCNHQETIQLQEISTYNISIGLNCFNIKHNEKSTKTVSDPYSKVAFILNYSWSIMLPTFLILGIFFIGTTFLFDFLTQCISISIHAFIYMIVPLYIRYFKICFRKNSSTEEDKEHIKLYKKCFTFGSIATGISTALMLIVSFLLPEALIYYVIFSVIASLILEIIAFAKHYDLSFLKIFAIVNIAVLIISLIPAYAPRNTGDLDGVDGWTECYKCNKTGKVRNDLGFYVTCPRCDGVGYMPD